MVANIVTDHQVLDLTILGKLHEHLLVEILKVLNGGHSVFLGYVSAIGESNC
jgi:hypothetical protein